MAQCVPHLKVIFLQSTERLKAPLTILPSRGATNHYQSTILNIPVKGVGGGMVGALDPRWEDPYNCTKQLFPDVQLQDIRRAGLEEGKEEGWGLVA